MANTKPFVVVATSCEKILTEKDGVCSLIRIVDTYHIPDISPEVPPDAQMPFQALIVLKSGDLKGQFEVGLQIRKPDGTISQQNPKWPILLNGGEHGANVLLTFALPPSILGLYWIDVLWGDEVLTSFPVKLAKQQQTVADQPDTSSPK
ncbi:MAG: hypothetical protein KF790_01045 [Steroidobacteraceae bacterium]|nr:hypothetical protein [Steroidobacteraceae bacterium]MCW5571815.1 hypothetical protein [Steroidobacteraceae bacterium]